MKQVGVYIIIAARKITPHGLSKRVVERTTMTGFGLWLVDGGEAGRKQGLLYLEHW